MDKIDTGFIVFNPTHYPRFSAWLQELEVATKTTDMSFAVRDDVTGFEYGTDRLSAMLCDTRSLVKPKFWSMWRDLVRFYRTHSSASVINALPNQTLGDYLEANGYGRPFLDSHLMPMCSALWSQPYEAAKNLDVRNVIEFMYNHQLLELTNRPVWSVINGGSHTYVDAFASAYRGEIRCNEPVVAVRRRASRVDVVTSHGATESFDRVVLACHSDQALKILEDPTHQEKRQLSSMPYQSNRVTLHSDPRWMPRRRTAWSSWNVVRDEHNTITYWMNRLQGLDTSRDYFVTLNPESQPADIHWSGTYEHPVFSVTNRNIALPQEPTSRVLFAGAYLGNGFHESGFYAGLKCANAIATATAGLEHDRALSHVG